MKNANPGALNKHLKFGHGKEYIYCLKAGIDLYKNYNLKPQYNDLRTQLSKSLAVDLQLPEQVSSEIINYFEDAGILDIIPPLQNNDTQRLLHVGIYVSSGSLRAISYKPWNIVINFKHCFGHGISVLFPLLDAICDSPEGFSLLTIIPAIVSAISLGQIKLDETATAVLFVLWQHNNAGTVALSTNADLQEVNDVLCQYGSDNISISQFYKVIQYLIDIKVIEYSNQEYHLIEGISFFQQLHN